MKQVLRIRSIRFSFQLVCLAVIIAIWTKIPGPATHLCRLNKYNRPAVLINVDDKSQKGLYLLQYVLFLTGDILSFPSSSLSKYTCLQTPPTPRGRKATPPTSPYPHFPSLGPQGGYRPAMVRSNISHFNKCEPSGSQVTW